MHRIVALAAAVVLVPTAAAIPPRKGLFVPGKSLGGLRLGMTPPQVRAALDDDERAQFEAHLREELERRPLVPMRVASVYLRAVKPDA